MPSATPVGRIGKHFAQPRQSQVQELKSGDIRRLDVAEESWGTSGRFRKSGTAAWTVRW